MAHAVSEDTLQFISLLPKNDIFRQAGPVHPVKNMEWFVGFTEDVFTVPELSAKEVCSLLESRSQGFAQKPVDRSSLQGHRKRFPE